MSVDPVARKVGSLVVECEGDCVTVSVAGDRVEMEVRGGDEGLEYMTMVSLSPSEAGRLAVWLNRAGGVAGGTLSPEGRLAPVPDGKEGGAR